MPLLLNHRQRIMAKGRKHSRKLVCLITDGFSNGMDPVPIAQELKADNITIMTIGENKIFISSNNNVQYQHRNQTSLFSSNIQGIQSGNSVELHNIASAPGEDHSFLLDSFSQFESLARKALHNGE